MVEVCGQVPQGLLQVTAQLCGCPGEDIVLSNSEQSLCMANEQSACPGGPLSPCTCLSDVVVYM